MAKTEITEHLLTLTDIVDKYQTRVNASVPSSSPGLTTAQVSQLLQFHGENRLNPPKIKRWYFKYFECLSNVFNVILIFAGLLELSLYWFNPVEYFNNVYIGSILVSVALVNSGIEFYELQKIAAIISAFNSLVSQKSNVMRNGESMTVLSTQLVPGDVILLKPGDKIPADIILFHTSEFRVDNSSLTGESEPQSRYPCKDAQRGQIKSHFALEAQQESPYPLESKFLIFQGMICLSGEAFGIVLRTGEATLFAKIAKMSRKEKTKRSPISNEIRRFCKIISFIAICTATILFLVAWIRSQHFNYSLQFAVGILVGFLPQGLPLIVTIIFTISGRKMSQRNVLVKDLHGVETLGAITMLLTDKTGTLTTNVMRVSHVWTNLEMYFAGGEKKDMKAGERAIKLDQSGITQLLHVSAVCTRAKFDRMDVPVKDRTVTGDATDAGLFHWAASKLMNIDKLNTLYPKVFELAISSDSKIHLTIHRKSHQDGGLTLFVKGAPERILELCSMILIDNKPKPITESHREDFWRAFKQISAQGNRVIAFATCLLPGAKYPDNAAFTTEKSNWPQSGYTFLGIASLNDPPKQGVRESIGKIRGAGIKVVMITGDHPLTAESLSRRINLLTTETKQDVATRLGKPLNSITTDQYSAVSIHGSEIDALSQEDWDTILSKQEILFSRTSPKQKLLIVEKAQSMGHVIAVVGDGVNDSGALKRADLGISMNKTGSDASKEAAGMILLDDDFSSILHGIYDGRLVFVNLKKSIQYYLTHLIPEVIPNMLYVLVPLPLALSVIQILMIDLGFEMFNTLSFAFEAAEYPELIMKLPPRKPVTIETVAYLRIKQLQTKESQQPVEDSDGSLDCLVAPEGTDSLQVTSKWRRIWRELMNMKNRTYWRKHADEMTWMIRGSRKEERLVDGEVLSWAFLEGGMIECTGSLIAFFLVFYWTFGIDPSDAVRAISAQKVYFRPHSPPLPLNNGSSAAGPIQVEALRQAQSAYYLSVLIIQLWNLFACKARSRLPVGGFMFVNKWTWVSLVSGTAFAFFIVYVPGVNDLFQTSGSLDLSFIGVPLITGGFLFVYSIGRRLVLRVTNPTKWVPQISGLEMKVSFDNLSMI